MTPLDRIEKRDRVPAAVVYGADGCVRVFNESGAVIATDAADDVEPIDDGLGFMRWISTALALVALLVTGFFVLGHLIAFFVYR